MEKVEVKTVQAAKQAQPALDQALTMKLQRLQIKMTSTSLMITELYEEINSLINALLAEIQRLQTKSAEKLEEQELG